MDNRFITVCSRCLRACCWHGEFMCDEARSAGTVNWSAEADRWADEAKIERGNECAAHSKGERAEAIGAAQAFEKVAAVYANRAKGKPIRNLSTPENREFWKRCDENSAEVATWPDWRRATVPVSDPNGMADESEGGRRE